MNQTELAYVQGTSQVDCTATTEATANTIRTLGAVSLTAGQVVLLEFFCPYWQQSSTAEVSFIPIFDAIDAGAAAAIGRIWDARAFATGQQQGSVAGWWRYTIPSSGSHVFSARGYVSGASTFSLFAGAGGAGTDVPMFLRVVQVG